MILASTVLCLTLLPACNPPPPPVVHWVIVARRLAGGSGVVADDDVSSAEVPEAPVFRMALWKKQN